MLLGGIGVDLDEFVDTPVPAGPPSFLLIARMLREKGVLEFVEAAGVLKREFTDARFRLVGGLDPSPGGISADQMRAFAATGSVEWSGELPDVRGAWPFDATDSDDARVRTLADVLASTPSPRPGKM